MSRLTKVSRAMMYAQPEVPVPITAMGAIPNNPEFDCTPALNSMISAGHANGYKNWFVPEGVFTFLTRPEVIDVDGFVMRGLSNDVCKLHKGFVSESNSDALLAIRAHGFGLSDFDCLSVDSAQNKSDPANWRGTGSLISLVATADHVISRSSIQRMRLSAEGPLKTSAGSATGIGAYHKFAIVADGTAHPSGIRNVSLHDVMAFGGEEGALYINSAYLVGMNLTTVPAGGKTGKVIVEGLGGYYGRLVAMPAVISNGIEFRSGADLCDVQGEFQTGTIEFKSGAQTCFTRGVRTGSTSVVNNGTGCAHKDYSAM